MKGRLELPKMNGVELKPGITCIGEPTPIPGTNNLRVLANVFGALAVVECSVRFVKEEDATA